MFRNDLWAELTLHSIRHRLSARVRKTMKTKAALLAAMCLAPLSIGAQTSAVPTMDHEPHHHLALQNDFVKVFKVEVAPGDSIILHSHDADTIAIAIGDQL